MKKKLLCTALAAVMVLGLCACGGDEQPAGDNNGESTATGAAFKLGGTGPLTGSAAIYGVAAKNGAQIAVDEINALGGDIQFDLRYEDDVNDPEKAVNAYNTLKDWGMQISLGSVTSKPGESTSVENNADRIFALTPSASSAANIEGKDNVFQMCFMDPNQGSASAQSMPARKRWRPSVPPCPSGERRGEAPPLTCSPWTCSQGGAVSISRGRPPPMSGGEGRSSALWGVLCPPAL